MNSFKYYFNEGKKYKCHQKIKVSKFNLKDYPKNEFVAIDCVVNEDGREIKESITIAANKKVIDKLIEQLEKIKNKLKD